MWTQVIAFMGHGTNSNEGEWQDFTSGWAVAACSYSFEEKESGMAKSRP
jgi:hypothetical protein